MSEKSNNNNFNKAGKFLEIIRSKQAFDLAQIESDLAKEEKQRIQWELFHTGNPVHLRDKTCQDKCNENLQLGLDMVKVFLPIVHHRLLHYFVVDFRSIIFRISIT